MLAKLIKLSKRIFSFVFPDFVNYENNILPAKHLRQGGKNFRSNEDFFASALKEAERLSGELGLSLDSAILDIGCGVGRLPIGLLARKHSFAQYWGVDVSEGAIKWCQRHLSSKDFRLQFVRLDVKNDRYNPGGKIANNNFQFPFAGQFGIIYLYSVFSHMTSGDIKIYLKEFSRLLAPTGKIFLTAFVEERVADLTINPKDYRQARWIGSLHCVRYSKDFFNELLDQFQFKIMKFDYAQETNGQSGIYIVRK